MCRCLYCHGMFFKTLSTRYLPLTVNDPESRRATLLYKKRCKRCKTKFYFRKDFCTDYPRGISKPVALSVWENASKLEGVDTRARMLASEYTRRIGRPADRALSYLNTLEKARKYNPHDNQKNPIQKTGGQRA